MATLTLPITDALAHQLPASVEILKKESPLSPQADGASFYNPEDSPSQGKYVPQKESISTPSTTKVEAPASSTPYTSVQNPLRTASVPKDVTDPLAFIDTYLNVAPKWSSESELEREILRQQISKREQIVHQKQRDSDVAIALEARIRNREAQLGALQAEMKRKVKHIDSKKEALEQFRVDFADAVKQQMQDASSSTVQKSSQTRMREEQEKKRLLSEWKTSNSDDQIQSVRRTILVSQDEVNDLNFRIVNLKKELELLHHMASKEISSKFIMLEQREKRKQMTPREHEPTAPKVYAPPPAPIVRSHLSRMAEAKENKERARAARLAAGSVPASPANYASSSSSSSSSNKQHP